MVLFGLPETDWVRLKEPEEEIKKPARPRPKVIEKREKKRQEKLRELEEEKPPLPPKEILVKREAAVWRVSELVLLYGATECCGQS